MPSPCRMPSLLKHFSHYFNNPLKTKLQVQWAYKSGEVWLELAAVMWALCISINDYFCPSPFCWHLYITRSWVRPLMHGSAYKRPVAVSTQVRTYLHPSLISPSLGKMISMYPIIASIKAMIKNRPNMMAPFALWPGYKKYLTVSCLHVFASCCWSVPIDCCGCSCCHSPPEKSFGLPTWKEQQQL